MEEFNNETETLIHLVVYITNPSLLGLMCHIIIMCIISKAHHRKLNAPLRDYVQVN